MRPHAVTAPSCTVSRAAPALGLLRFAALLVFFQPAAALWEGGSGTAWACRTCSGTPWGHVVHLLVHLL